MIAFSSSDSVRRRGGETHRETVELANDQLSPLFQAVAEATEEAIYNSLFMATTVTGHRGTSEAIPLDSTRAVLGRYGVVR